MRFCNRLLSWFTARFLQPIAAANKIALSYSIYWLFQCRDMKASGWRDICFYMAALFLQSHGKSGCQVEANPDSPGLLDNFIFVFR
jgi:hypothetical protein